MEQDRKILAQYIYSKDFILSLVIIVLLFLNWGTDLQILMKTSKIDNFLNSNETYRLYSNFPLAYGWEKMYYWSKELQAYLVTIQLLFYLLKDEFGILLINCFKFLNEKFFFIFMIFFLVLLSFSFFLWLTFNNLSPYFESFFSTLVCTLALFISFPFFMNEVKFLKFKLIYWVFGIFSTVGKVILFMVFADYTRNELLYRKRSLDFKY